MEDLANSNIVHSKTGNTPMPTEEIQNILGQLPEWNVIEAEGEKRLQRTYKFKDFRQALDFTLSVGELAERLDHHPTLLTAWGKVTVSWWTHTIGGLHNNDFIAAAKTDRLYQAG